VGQRVGAEARASSDSATAPDHAGGHNAHVLEVLLEDRDNKSLSTVPRLDILEAVTDADGRIVDYHYRSGGWDTDRVGIETALGVSILDHPIQVLRCRGCGKLSQPHWTVEPRLVHMPGWWQCQAHGCNISVATKLPDLVAWADANPPWDTPPDMVAAALAETSYHVPTRPPGCPPGCTLRPWTAERVRTEYQLYLHDSERPDRHRAPKQSTFAMECLKAGERTFQRHRQHIGLPWPPA
jgi:hypothetical protein